MVKSLDLHLFHIQVGKPGRNSMCVFSLMRLRSNLQGWLFNSNAIMLLAYLWL